MKAPPYFLKIPSLIVAGFLLAQCRVRVKTEAKSVSQMTTSSNDHLYQNSFGNKYYALGTFTNGGTDSIETKLWQYSRLDTGQVLFGNFSDGMPVNEWQFVLKAGSRFVSDWKPYKNNATMCSFSLPFSCEEVMIDSGCFQLKTMNDSLGKVTIVVNLGNAITEHQKLLDFGAGSEKGLVQQGYKFTKERHEIKSGNGTYFCTEFFMLDSHNKNVKFYNLYGNLPSKNHFVEFSIFHDGPKDDLVKTIFSMIANHMYINGERFYNPYFREKVM